MKESETFSEEDSDSHVIPTFSRNGVRKYRRRKIRFNKKKYSFEELDYNDNKPENYNETVEQQLGPDSDLVNKIMQIDKDKKKKKNLVINDENKNKKPEKEESNYGRKKKNSGQIGKHNKYSGDNLIRKCKGILLNALYLLINNIIEENYQSEPNYDKKTKKLLKINQNQIINSDVQYNQNFLDKKLKDIFSDNVTLRCSRYNIDHNEKLIKSLLDEKDEKKKKLFCKLFDLTFLDCLKHFRGTKTIKELKNLTKYEEVCKGFEEDEDYLYSFKYYIENYEKIIQNKKSRRKTQRKRKK